MCGQRLRAQVVQDVERLPQDRLFVARGHGLGSLIRTALLFPKRGRLLRSACDLARPWRGSNIQCSPRTSAVPQPERELADAPWLAHAEHAIHSGPSLSLRSGLITGEPRDFGPSLQDARGPRQFRSHLADVVFAFVEVSCRFNVATARPQQA